MYRLAAKFDIQLPSALLIQRDESEKICYEIPIENFDVEVSLTPFEKGDKQKHKDEQYYSFGITRVFIKVTGNEEVEPPPVTLTKEGGKDYSHQALYCLERAPKYQKIALTAVNRLIRYFKYELQNPLLYELFLHDKQFSTPEWFDQNGEEIGKYVHIRVESIPGLMPNSYSAKKLTKKDDERLKKALQEDKTYELYDEILSDAQAAIFQSNLRRVILEMAIACEVAIKQTLFLSSTAAGSVFEYLEDKGRINISVIELIDGVARETFGESFKNHNSTAFKNIDYLFRCRNKVAHRGQTIFRDDSGIKQWVDGKIIKEWWESIELLFKWLKKYQDQD